MTVAGELRIGVPGSLLELAAEGGHGKVWRRVLYLLAASDVVVALPARRRFPGVRQPRIDVVLADGHNPLPERIDAPLAVQVHEAGWFEPELRAVLNPEFLAHIERYTGEAVARADAVIAPSRAAAAGVVDGYAVDPRRVHAVWHGVDQIFTPNAGPSPLERPYVLFAAQLHPRKNLGAVRDAVATLAAEGFPHHLAIAGMAAADRPDRGELEAAASAELPGAPGRIEFFGRVSDLQLAALMAGADAYCLPSLYEGFGMTVAEAMASATPVIVSDRGALPEVVGDAGAVVAPQAAAVAAALRRVLGDAREAERMREAGLRRARELTWERTAAGWREVLAAIARGPVAGS